MAKFTFRRVPRTGRFRTFEQRWTEIKLKKKVVGSLTENRREGHWRIRFAVKKEKTEKDPAPFKWVTLKHKPDSEEAGRRFILKFNDEIQEKCDLHPFGD